MAFDRASSYADADVMNKCNEFCKALETTTFVRYQRGKAVANFTTLEDTINQNTERIIEIFMAIRKDINPRSFFSKEKEIDFKVYYAQSL